MVLLLLLAARIVVAQPIPDNLRAVLSADWGAAAKFSRGKPTSVDSLLVAHAQLLTNQDAFCGFQDQTAAPAWDAFTAHPADSHSASAVVHYLRGDAFARLGKSSEAMREFDTSIGLDAGFAAVYNARGVLHASQGRFDPALQDFIEAQRRDPKLADAIANRGWLALQSRMGGAVALRWFDRALQIGPKSLNTRAGRVYALVILGREKEVQGELAALTRAASGCFQEALARNLLALAEWSAGRREKELLASEAGTNITRDLNTVLKGASGSTFNSALNRLASAAGADPFQKTRITTALNHFATSNPKLGAQIGVALANGSTRTSPTGMTGILFGALQGLTLSAGSRTLGASVTGRYIGQNFVHSLLTQHSGFQTLQSGLKPSVPGGVRTLLPTQHYDRGDYPVTVQYVLGYPMQKEGR